ncbi:MAG: hypothetical protein HFE04_02250 [Bacilli bacterium]|nr:hypothetical protein [Bacilli bacterium]
MKYRERKKKLIKQREEILKDYQILLSKVIEYGQSTMEYSEEEIASKTEEEKMLRNLLVTLLYVEHPENTEIRSALRKVLSSKGRNR